MSASIETILEFWFGTFPDAWSVDKTKTDMWFANGAAYDTEIFTTFGDVYHDAITGELEHWKESPRGRLALIILLDQFSRHIHRGTAEQFAQDLEAQQLCVDGISMGYDQKLHPVERAFFYMPLEHAENMERQDLSLQAFAGLVHDVPESHQAYFQEVYKWADRHHYVVEQFGRFPELNKLLGRESTDEELAFIAQGEFNFL